jgi:hypothetical protein
MWMLFVAMVVAKAGMTQFSPATLGPFDRDSCWSIAASINAAGNGKVNAYCYEQK